MEKNYLKEFLKEVKTDDWLASLITKVLKGTPAARKTAIKELCGTSNVHALISTILETLKEPNLEITEQERLQKLLVKTLQSQPCLGNNSPVVQTAPQLIVYVKNIIPRERSLSVRDATKNSLGFDILANLARLIGLKLFITVLRPTFDEIEHLPMNAVIIAICAQTFGIPLVLPLVQTLIKDKHHVACQLGLAIVQDLPSFAPSSLLPLLPTLVSYCATPLTETALSNSANSAVTALADKAAPFGFKAFETVLPLLWSGAKKRKGRAMLGYLRSLAAIIPCVPQERRFEMAEPLLEMIGDILRTPSDIDEKRHAISISSRCAPHAKTESVLSLLKTFFSLFWHKYTDHRLGMVLLKTTAELPIGKSEIVKELVNANVLVSDDPRLVKLGLQLLARLLRNRVIESVKLDSRYEERLVDGLIASLPSPNDDAEKEETIVDIGESREDSDFGASTTDRISVHALVNTLHSLSRESALLHSRRVTATLLERCVNASPVVRENSLRILGGISSLLPATQLRHVLRRLYEELGEEFPEVLAEVIGALNSILEALIQLEELPTDPRPGEIITRTSPILRNSNERVQSSCMNVIRTLSESAGEAIPAREWMHICFELLGLQKSSRQSIRFEATAVFAKIASVIGPAYVVMTLVSHLKSPDRQFRVTTSAAIASVAAETGPFTTFPVLLNEYSQGDVVVQHGVLKTLAFTFDFLQTSDETTNYIAPLISLIDDALLASNQVHRQTAATIVHYMALASVAKNKEDIFQHFLNELVPSIFETSPHVIDRVLEAINSIGCVVGGPCLAMYLWLGLFHPARKVRNVYRRLWDLTYCDSAAELVYTYPFETTNPFANARHLVSNGSNQMETDNLLPNDDSNLPDDIRDLWL